MINTHNKKIQRANFNFNQIFKRKKTKIESKEITLIVLLYILLQWEFWKIKIRFIL